MLPYSQVKDDRVFEQLCYDLVQRLQFNNVRWRGPGADGGRDIEAEWHYTDPTGNITIEEWFIECKYYTGSVPFSEIESKLLAADTSRKNCLLVITSSQLSNTCLDSVTKWLELRRHSLRFRYWNGHDLARRIVGHPGLLSTYFGIKDPDLVTRLSSEITQMQGRLVHVAARLERKIIGSGQALAGGLANTKGMPVALQHEAQLHLASVQAIRLMADGFETASPYVRPVIVRPLLQMLSEYHGKAHGYSPAISGTEATALSSEPLLLVAISEILQNAILYKKSIASINLTQANGFWRLVVENDHDLPFQEKEWPRLGARHEAVRKRHPSGLGQGCWLADRIIRTLKHTVEWAPGPTTWTVTVSGVSVEAIDD